MLKVQRECFCEHCGELPEFDVVYDDDLCTWCLDCARYNEEFNEAFTDEDIHKAMMDSYIKRLAWLKKQVKDIEHLLDTHGVDYK
jgi:hypothetical protein